MTAQCDVTVVNQRGLHARASAKFVGAVSELPDGVTVRVAKDGNEAGGGSILGLMMLGAAKDDMITLIVTCDGDGDGDAKNEEAVLEQISALVADGFGEE